MQRTQRFKNFWKAKSLVFTIGNAGSENENPAEGDKAVFPATKPCVNHQ